MRNASWRETDPQAGGWRGGKQWRRSRREGAAVTGPAGRIEVNEQ